MGMRARGVAGLSLRITPCRGAREAGLPPRGTGDCKAMCTKVRLKWPSPTAASVFTKEPHIPGREFSTEATALSLCWASGRDPGLMLPLTLSLMEGCAF